MQDARAGMQKAGQQNRGVSSSVSEALDLSEKSMEALKKKAEKSGQKLQKNECREKKFEPKNDKKKTESTQRA